MMKTAIALGVLVWKALARFFAERECPECKRLGTMCDTCVHCEWGIR